jgi:hypothetical protein
MATKRAAVPSVLHQAPLGTYLGWNLTAAGFFAGRGCGFSGGYVPFARTRAERQAAGDPRPSVEERYGTLEGYACVVEKAARRAVTERFLLQSRCGPVGEGGSAQPRAAWRARQLRGKSTARPRAVCASGME